MRITDVTAFKALKKQHQPYEFSNNHTTCYCVLSQCHWTLITDAGSQLLLDEYHPPNVQTNMFSIFSFAGSGPRMSMSKTLDSCCLAQQQTRLVPQFFVFWRPDHYD